MFYRMSLAFLSKTNLDVRFGSKAGQIGPIWDLFRLDFSTSWLIEEICNDIWSKKDGFVPMVPIWSQCFCKHCVPAGLYIYVNNASICVNNTLCIYFFFYYAILCQNNGWQRGLPDWQIMENIYRNYQQLNRNYKQLSTTYPQFPKRSRNSPKRSRNSPKRRRNSPKRRRTLSKTE